MIQDPKVLGFNMNPQSIEDCVRYSKKARDGRYKLYNTITEEFVVTDLTDEQIIDAAEIWFVSNKREPGFILQVFN